jgi:cold-inducible RNA-binding protein
MAVNYKNLHEILVLAFSFMEDLAKKDLEELVLNKKLYVGGLSYNTTEASLESLFAQAGQIDTVRIITDRETGRAKGFGFVEMSTEDEASRAISLLNGTNFEGRTLSVNEAKPQTDRSQRSGNQYNGYRGGSRY